MENPSMQSDEDPLRKSENEEKASVNSIECGKRVTESGKPSVAATSKLSAPTSSSIRKNAEPRSGSESRSRLTKPTVSASMKTSNSVPVVRRNSTGGLPEKSSASAVKQTTVGKKSTSSPSEPTRRSLPELRRSSLPSVITKATSTRVSISETRKSLPVSPVDSSLSKSTGSDVYKKDRVKKVPVKPSLSASVSSLRVSSTPLDSSGSSVSRKTVSKLSSSSTRSPSISSGSKTRSLSSSLDRNSSLSGRRRAGTPESRDSRFIILPHVETKAGDDMRLDLRGHRVRSLNAGGLNLQPNLEFVYLRDNLLSSLDGIEILTCVKVLDLSFNEFKGPGFEPLENCKVLQQLYLAGNQITSLASLPQLPNLEFLSVAQNKLKSLAMASQPRLQVLAASKNKISTLKGFPHLPLLEHLRVEENPILKKPHVQAASVLLVGPTLKKFNDRDLSRDEIALSKRYPAHTAVCIQDGWELCRPELAADSTFCFLFEQWKDFLPSGYLLKEALIDQPFEEDACHCHFNFVQDAVTVESELVLKYQWFLGERVLSNFVAIPDASSQVYWPKREHIGKYLKVECTPTLGDTEYPPIFAMSSPVGRGNGIPKVVNLEVLGELVEGSIVKGVAEVAWCGGTPGKGVASWLRRRWNSSPVIIAGAEDEEYQLTIDDIGSSLVFMYTPVCEEGAKGEPQYKYTEFIKAGALQINPP